jgi:hypothetical protein
LHDNSVIEAETQQQEPLPDTAHTQRTEPADEESQYADLRSSRMIEFYTEENISEDRLFPHAEEIENESQDTQGNVSVFQLQNETEEWTVKSDEEENAYGHLSESCQYRVLSLRRNFQPNYPAECSQGANDETESHEVENQADTYHFIFPCRPTDSDADA